MRALLPLLAVALLPACVLMQPPVPVADQCGAGGLQTLVGLNVRVLPPQGTWSSLRIIRPGMIVTMDFSATRLNAHVDGAGRISALTCG